MSVLQLRGPNFTPFSAEKENLILGLWQLQQAGQDFRIKQVCFVLVSVTCGAWHAGRHRLVYAVIVHEYVQLLAMCV